MVNLTISTLIGAPIKRVFDYMSTPENDFQWQYGTLATSTIANPQNQMGIYFRSIGHLMGHRNLGTYEVVESNRNRKYRFRSISGPLHSQTSYTFKSVGNSTKIDISIRIGSTNFFHINERILGRRIKQQLRENLIVLKELLEVEQLPPASETNALVI